MMASFVMLSLSIHTPAPESTLPTASSHLPKTTKLKTSSSSKSTPNQKPMISNQPANNYSTNQSMSLTGSDTHFMSPQPTMLLGICNLHQKLIKAVKANPQIYRPNSV
jgi:hypothetical protein